jgi:hypothetical protein
LILNCCCRFFDGNGPDDHRDGEYPDSGEADRFGQNAEFYATKRAPDSGDFEEYLSNNNYFSTHNGISESIEQAISDQASVCDHTPAIQHSAKSDHPCLSESPGFPNSDISQNSECEKVRRIDGDSVQYS